MRVTSVRAARSGHACSSNPCASTRVPPTRRAQLASDPPPSPPQHTAPRPSDHPSLRPHTPHRLSTTQAASPLCSTHARLPLAGFLSCKHHTGAPAPPLMSRPPPPPRATPPPRPLLPPPAPASCMQGTRTDYLATPLGRPHGTRSRARSQAARAAIRLLRRPVPRLPARALRRQRRTAPPLHPCGSRALRPAPRRPAVEARARGPRAAVRPQPPSARSAPRRRLQAAGSLRGGRPGEAQALRGAAGGSAAAQQRTVTEKLQTDPGRSRGPHPPQPTFVAGLPRQLLPQQPQRHGRPRALATRHQAPRAGRGPGLAQRVLCGVAQHVGQAQLLRRTARGTCGGAHTRANAAAGLSATGMGAMAAKQRRHMAAGEAGPPVAGGRAGGQAGSHPGSRRGRGSGRAPRALGRIRVFEWSPWVPRC